MPLTALFTNLDGDLVRQYRDLDLPVHAYIPMSIGIVGLPRPLENNPVAYLDQMRAKRVCDKYRKREKRRHPNSKLKFIIMGVTVK